VRRLEPFSRSHGAWQLIGLGSVLAAACAVSSGPQRAENSIDLPPGDGRAILETQCLVCHELGALTLFEDFYNRDRWRSLVITMRANGAVVDDDEVEVLADYLATHFGTGN